MKTTVPAEPTSSNFVHARRIILHLALVFVLLVSGCVSTDAVSKFATQSSQALAQGQPIVEDLEASCIRQHLAEQDIPADLKKLFDPSAVKVAAADPACVDYAAVQPGLLALLKVMTDYFTALSQLASTGTASTGKSASTNAQTAKTSNSDSNVLSALTNISTFLGQVATNGYREKQLAHDIEARDPDVAIVISALKEVVQGRYEKHQLDSEQNSITQAYLGLLSKTSDPAIRALFRNQWQADVALIDAKRAAADAFVKALDTIQEGHNKLATNAGKINPKDLPALIQPYTDSLSNLAPSLQKVL